MKTSRVTASALEVVGELGRRRQLPRVHRVDRRVGLRAYPGALVLAVADEKGSELAAVGAQRRHLQRRRVEPVLRRVLPLRGRDLGPPQTAQREEQVVHRDPLRRAARGLDELPLRLARALYEDHLTAG